MKNTNHPPRLAAWLVNLFVSEDQAPSILGDLREEFSTLASQRSLRYARSWYWRQVSKTIPHVFYAELFLEPWQTFTTLVAGLVLLWLANVPMISLTWNYYPYHWPEPLRLVWLVCFPIVALILPPMLSGCIVGVASKKRGMIVTILLSFAVLAARVTLRSLYPGHVPGPPSVWSLLWLEAEPANVVVWPAVTLLGGLIARKTAPHLVGPARRS
jgi:hypothetical protein